MASMFTLCDSVLRVTSLLLFFCTSGSVQDHDQKKPDVKSQTKKIRLRSKSELSTTAFSVNVALHLHTAGDCWVQALLNVRLSDN